MKVIIHNLSDEYNDILKEKCDYVIKADGKYSHCRGCFGCWTKHPAECYIKDSLKQACRIIGQADELVIITDNFYGTYSADIKCILDRSIGVSTPMSTYRNKEMHHTLRYGRNTLWKNIVYGDVSEEEKETFRYVTERNAINFGYKSYETLFVSDVSETEGNV